MSEPPIRFATAADLPELVRVINAAYQVEAFFVTGDRTDPADVAARMARPGAGFLVAEAGDGAALAGAVYLERRGDRMYLGMLSVDPARQGAGLGRRLVEAVEAHTREAGCCEIEIEVVNLREELPGFYRRLGFVVIGEAPFHTSSKLLRPAHMILMRKGVDGRGRE